MGIHSTKLKKEIPKNVILSITRKLENEGYLVKRNFQYPKRLSSFNPSNLKVYFLDIFAYRKADDIVFVKYENCDDVFSHENENIWRSISAKPGVKFHILVPSCCKERAQIKSRILNLPVKIDCINDWNGPSEFKCESAK